jgi:hypothetical protein
MNYKLSQNLSRYSTFFVRWAKRLLVAACLLPSRSSLASFLPVSRHQQFLTYSFFVEEQFALLVKEAGTIWTGIGDNCALYEFQDQWHSQLVLSGSVNFSLRHNSGFLDNRTETFDARFGVLLDSAVTRQFRFSAGIVHWSGHTADGLLNPELAAPNVGDNLLFIRGILDGNFYRIGATLKPVVDSDPKAKWFAADQFIELYPFGISKERLAPNYYVSFSLDEFGMDQVDVSFHTQMGLFFGNHHEAIRQSTLRVMAGYYSGIDPRFKYAQLKNGKQSFFYLGTGLNF